MPPALGSNQLLESVLQGVCEVELFARTVSAMGFATARLDRIYRQPQASTSGT